MTFRMRSIRPILAWLVLLLAVTFRPRCSRRDLQFPVHDRIDQGAGRLVHVWTLGVEGWGDGSDKLVTVDANPRSKKYGKS